MASKTDPDALTALAARAAKGDRDAFRGWLQASHRVVFAVALRLVGNREDAEDVVQTTYVRAWQGMPNLQKPEASLGWVCGIARHVALDRRRQVHRHPTETLDGEKNMDVEDARGVNPESHASSQQTRARVRDALGRLSDDHREVLELREMHGLSYDEVAAVLSVPVGTVESRVHRARTALARALRQLLGGDHAVP